MQATSTIRYLLLALLLFATVSNCLGQATATAAERGAETAKNGFRNESEIAAKFDDWRNDADARAWLASMNFKLEEIKTVKASKPHGEKADVLVTIETRRGTVAEGISIKLVSNPNGFNQIDKRWLSAYERKWKMPSTVAAGLKLFLGETKPTNATRTPGRMYLTELEAETRDQIVDFFTAKRSEIISDLFEGDGTYAAKWFMVAMKSGGQTKWVIQSARSAAEFFSEGPVTVTRAGNLRIGRITMQRKGGDGGRETAKMLQFKINPALLLK